MFRTGRVDWSWYKPEKPSKKPKKGPKIKIKVDETMVGACQLLFEKVNGEIGRINNGLGRCKRFCNSLKSITKNINNITKPESKFSAKILVIASDIAAQLDLVLVIKMFGEKVTVKLLVLERSHAQEKLVSLRQWNSASIFYFLAQPYFKSRNNFQQFLRSRYGPIKGLPKLT